MHSKTPLQSVKMYPSATYRRISEARSDSRAITRTSPNNLPHIDRELNSFAATPVFWGFDRSPSYHMQHVTHCTTKRRVSYKSSVNVQRL